VSIDPVEAAPILSCHHKVQCPNFLRRARTPNPFRIHTYKSLSKQSTLTTCRINTYEKPRGVGLATRQPQKSLSIAPPRVVTTTPGNFPRTLLSSNHLKRNEPWQIAYLDKTAEHHPSSKAALARLTSSCRQGDR